MDAIKIDHEHGEKAESFGGSGIPKAFSHVGSVCSPFSLNFLRCFLRRSRN
ncbi:hypothetical protein ALC60_12511 [Trachymyrmex zeteki]|uniref:Uncharacterized protein n=1 Tax=Mycetomoellerius zeteki TaxID=64791 RepID=A0A151WL96_9HYME|nr:hypothetical protein ALC60_12511 [Trachymyrmex zeteki]